MVPGIQHGQKRCSVQDQDRHRHTRTASSTRSGTGTPSASANTATAAGTRRRRTPPPSAAAGDEPGPPHAPLIARTRRYWSPAAPTTRPDSGQAAAPAVARRHPRPQRGAHLPVQTGFRHSRSRAAPAQNSQHVQPEPRQPPHLAGQPCIPSRKPPAPGLAARQGGSCRHPRHRSAAAPAAARRHHTTPVASLAPAGQ